MTALTFDYLFRKAEDRDTRRIWQILQQAIDKRNQEGSEQWQDGYPNQDTIAADLSKGYGYVLDIEEQIVAYVAVIPDGEPAYESIVGQWLTNGSYIVIHRLAVAQDVAYRGLGTLMMQLVEDVVKEQGFYSIKVDTNHDNTGMLRVFEKLGYQYCGEVILRGNARRKAFEKTVGEV